jgi:DNA-binding transcriptional LysR family regulator
MDHHDRIGRRLKLRDLHTFRTAAERGSMAKAAAQLAITQPAVSKAIADMESILGVRLLDRTPQGVAPTRYGEALLRRSTVLFDELEQAVKELDFLADPSVGEIRIGSSETLLHGLLPTVIERLTARYPRLQFHIVQAPIGPLFAALRARTLDIVVMRMSQAAEPDLEKARLFDDPVSVVTGVQSPWARKSRIALAELAEERWSLMPEEAIIGTFLAENFRAQGLKYPTLGVKCTSLQMHVSLLQTGHYLSVLPASFLGFSNARGAMKVLPVKLEGRPPPVGYAMLKDRTTSPMTKLFIEALRTTARRAP